MCRMETQRRQEFDAYNQEISRKITESGFAQIYTTELNGQKVLRDVYHQSADNSERHLRHRESAETAGKR